MVYTIFIDDFVINLDNLGMVEPIALRTWPFFGFFEVGSVTFFPWPFERKPGNLFCENAHLSLNIKKSMVKKRSYLYIEIYHTYIHNYDTQWNISEAIGLNHPLEIQHGQILIRQETKSKSLTLGGRRSTRISMVCLPGMCGGHVHWVHWHTIA